jgi:hypothetical protein
MQSDNLIKLKELTEKMCGFDESNVYYNSIKEIKENILQFENELKTDQTQKNKLSCYEKLHNKIKNILNKTKLG